MKQRKTFGITIIPVKPDSQTHRRAKQVNLHIKMDGLQMKTHIMKRYYSADLCQSAELI